VEDYARGEARQTEKTEREENETFHCFIFYIPRPLLQSIPLHLVSEMLLNRVVVIMRPSLGRVTRLSLRPSVRLTVCLVRAANSKTKSVHVHCIKPKVA